MARMLQGSVHFRLFMRDLRFELYSELMTTSTKIAFNITFVDEQQLFGKCEISIFHFSSDLDLPCDFVLTSWTRFASCVVHMISNWTSSLKVCYFNNFFLSYNRATTCFRRLKKIISLSSLHTPFSGPHQISFYCPDFFYGAFLRVKYLFELSSSQQYESYAIFRWFS